MSSTPQVRRADKSMAQDGIEELLTKGYSGHLATVGADGWPYVCPLLYVYIDGEVWLHNTRALGHLQRNITHNPRACFEVAVAGEVFPYGRFECDTSIEYQSIVAFGHVSIVSDRVKKAQFFAAFMGKYASKDSSRPEGFYPRLDEVTVYALSVERVTGKQTALPALDARWPAVDHTKSPHASPP